MKVIFAKTSRGLFIVADKIGPAKNSQSNLIYNATFFFNCDVYRIYTKLQGNRETCEFPPWDDTRPNLAIYLCFY